MVMKLSRGPNCLITIMIDFDQTFEEKVKALAQTIRDYAEAHSESEQTVARRVANELLSETDCDNSGCPLCQG